ncbi:4-coumarate--CoA ligase-like 7, partial [Fusarium oxysporum f. sp. albedinis]
MVKSNRVMTMALYVEKTSACLYIPSRLVESISLSLSGLGLGGEWASNGCEVIECHPKTPGGFAADAVEIYKGIQWEGLDCMYLRGLGDGSGKGVYSSKVLGTVGALQHSWTEARLAQGTE